MRARHLCGKNPGNLCSAAASNGGAEHGHCGRYWEIHHGIRQVRWRVCSFAARIRHRFSAKPRPTDPQIAHIAYTAGQLDIAAAQLALQKSKNKDVVAFATDMERDHKAVNEQALALVKKLNVTPEDNDTSKALTKQAAEKRAELAKLSGATFDKAYIDNEVAYHKTVNGALQNTLIPSATNPELKDLLTTGLKIFQGHEQHAEHVAAEFK